MSKSVGTLDYRSDHYWVVDRTGQDDYELQAGDSMEIWIEMHWLSTRIGSYSDSWRRLWRFLDMDGTMVIPRLGMSVQLEYDKLSKSASIFPSTCVNSTVYEPASD